MNINPRVLAIVLAMLCPAVFLLSLGLGRYEISPAEVGMILVARFIEVDLPQSPNQEAVIFNLRLPRVALAMVVGGGLALAGACLQGIFRNPLVSPQILGVASGSGFGGALGLLLGSSGWAYGLAFLFGLLALAAVFFIGTIRQERPVLMLVLAGIVVGGFFQALIALAQYLADPQDALPAITYWLMGSFAGATYRELVISIPILLCVAVLLKMRWWVNVLSMGADYAQTLGVNVEVKRWLIIVCVTVIVAISVSVSGIIGWVGLVIPHIGRMLVGPDHRALLPVSVALGSVYLVLIDNLARSLTPAEIPIGILTAVIGAPFFGYLLKKTHGGAWREG